MSSGGDPVMGEYMTRKEFGNLLGEWLGLDLKGVKSFSIFVNSENHVATVEVSRMLDKERLGPLSVEQYKIVLVRTPKEPDVQHHSVKEQ